MINILSNHFSNGSLSTSLVKRFNIVDSSLVAFSYPIRYEIEGVRNSLLKGERENPIIPWKTTERIFHWMDEIRRQIGVVYNADLQKL